MPSIMKYLTDIVYKKERESKPAFLRVSGVKLSLDISHQPG